jgi:lipoprotein-anchoring transpeptidase ErfK/SrfK
MRLRLHAGAVVAALASSLAAAAAQERRLPRPAPIDDATLAIQVALDRAGFSPGAVDGRTGANTRRALDVYRRQHGQDVAPASPALALYTITDQDAAGPFVERIPADLVAQAALPSLGYTSIVEALAERFHTTPKFLQQLNPEAPFAAGDQIQVPNVEPLVIPVEPMEYWADPAKETRDPVGTAGRGRRSGKADPAKANSLAQRPDVVVSVARSTSTLTVTDSAGRVLFLAPVTTGSEHDPLPIGEWKVNGLQFNPVFHYNPDLFWDANPAHTKARIPFGPNNPVGVVWIDLTKPHYGIHGTPEPSAIGRTQSHGCVRLTNWDAMRVAGLVKPGTKVLFTE